MQRNDVEAWCNALVLAMDKDNGQLSFLPHIVATAYFANREQFLRQAVKVAHDQPSGFPVSVLLNLINEIVKGSPPPAHTFVGRVFLSDSDYREFVITDGVLSAGRRNVAPK